MYEAFYHLHGKPFRLIPDAHMLYPSRGHKRAMSYLLYGLEQGEGFVMVTGDVGTGKTLLIQHLLSELSQRDIAVASIASANLDSDDILPAVASQFGLRYDGVGKETLLHTIHQHLLGLAGRGTRALLVMDEAQTLTASALEMLRILSNLEAHGQALLQVFLVGQSELRELLSRHHLEQLRQRIIASYRLEPMDLEETRQYIHHRLQQVGWRDDPTLSPGVLAGVHEASGGVPRRINLIMDRLLLFGYLEERHRLDPDALTTVLGEMDEELASAPAAATPPAMAPAPEPAPTALVSDAFQARMNAYETRLSALELRCNQVLLRVMREEVRLVQLLRENGQSVQSLEDPLAAHLEAAEGGHKAR